jgi:5'-deoxynucleotidase YfbR-like HD superfamily hydrolase
MGWSESYHTDMRAEAERELRRLSLPLREALEEFHQAVTVYRDFTDKADELESVLQRLEGLLAEHGPSS